ncbi:MAG: carboxypeptidase-like regulatory domain-containing protein, partial [Bacteroidia bacterium]|nr:carboxypeptidase-like regulatory domain-containing protein [Bacteroidia bacterium]
MTQIIVAQTKTTLIKGQITDESDAPIEFAAVVLNKDNNAILAGTVSNEEGLFLLKGEFSGKCKLTIKCIGYHDQEMEVVCGSQKIVDVGKIVLKELAYQIDEVFVTGERMQKTVSVDKTTINPSANMSSATGSVLEVLRSAASVSVDNDDNVSIRGNSNILILLDGIPTTVG